MSKLQKDYEKMCWTFGNILRRVRSFLPVSVQYIFIGEDLNDD